MQLRSPLLTESLDERSRRILSHLDRFGKYEPLRFMRVLGIGRTELNGLISNLLETGLISIFRYEYADTPYLQITGKGRECLQTTPAVEERSLLGLSNVVGVRLPKKKVIKTLVQRILENNPGRMLRTDLLKQVRSVEGLADTRDATFRIAVTDLWRDGIIERTIVPTPKNREMAYRLVRKIGG